MRLSSALRGLGGLLLLLSPSASRPAPELWDWTRYRLPNWQGYRAEAAKAVQGPASAPRQSGRDPGTFTFADLKEESDASLATRLMGENGKRVSYVDRHRERWYLYDSPNQRMASIDLYTHPARLGSQYGLCGVEKYTFEFDTAGRIAGVSVTSRYGVEGDVFQKEGFDWADYENRVCAAAPAAHAPSYFPAEDASAAQTVVHLLGPVIDLSGSGSPLPFTLTCRTWTGEPCHGGNRREYLARLRLSEIDEVNAAGCPIIAQRPPRDCFTIVVGKGRIGPFPKYITVRGSTAYWRIQVDSVDIVESQTIS